MVNKHTTGTSGGSRSGIAHGKARRRARGRPKAEASEDVRQKLLKTAGELFVKYGYRAVSSRQIAAAAGANVAMIRYYFGGKPGLYREVVNGLVRPLHERIGGMSASAASFEIRDLVGIATRLWANNPWLPGLVVREVLVPDAPLRGMFLREFPERVVPLVENLVRREIAAGRLRGDLDPRLTVLSMISLCVFPFLALPVTSKVFGVRLDDEFLQQLIQHTTGVLQRGLAAPAGPEKEP